MMDCCFLAPSHAWDQRTHDGPKDSQGTSWWSTWRLTWEYEASNINIASKKFKQHSYTNLYTLFQNKFLEIGCFIRICGDGLIWRCGTSKLMENVKTFIIYHQLFSFSCSKVSKFTDHTKMWKMFSTWLQVYWTERSSKRFKGEKQTPPAFPESIRHALWEFLF